MTKLVAENKPNLEVVFANADHDYEVRVGGEVLYAFEVGDIKRFKAAQLLMAILREDGYESQEKFAEEG